MININLQFPTKVATLTCFESEFGLLAMLRVLHLDIKARDNKKKAK